MSMTRRETLKALASVSAVAGLGETARAAPRSSPVPIVTTGGTRLYLTSIFPQWWCGVAIPNLTWSLPSDRTTNPPPMYVTGDYVVYGAQTSPDHATALQDVRNTPFYGVFTRGYLQLVTRPLQGAQTVNGTVSMAVHCIQWHRKIGATLALQVTVHRSDGSLRGLALPVTRDATEFPLESPARTRAAIGWPLVSVAADDGDVIAINIGIWADNQTRTLAQGVGFAFYANQTSDIAYLDSADPGNSWVEFSSQPIFRP